LPRQKYHSTNHDFFLSCESGEPHNRDAAHLDASAASAIFDAATIDLAQEMIRDTQAHDARTFAQLLAFMRKYRLMFAAADQGSVGMEGYTQLYGGMRELKKRLGIKDAEPELGAVADDFQAGSVWITRNPGREDGILTVLERDGERFKAQFQPKRGVICEIHGTIRAGRVLVVWPRCQGN
jgi:hypothetical protein